MAYEDLKELARRYGVESDTHKAERLEREAAALMLEAGRLEGTSWLGDISPSEATRREAADKREYAALLRARAKR